MQVYTWESTAPPAPRYTWAARIWTGGDFLPVTFHAETKDDVIAKAVKHWDDQMDAIRKRQEASGARSAARRKKSDAPAAAAVEEAF